MSDHRRPGAKGIEMEEALRAYFFEAGYFVVRGVPFQLEGEDVTDIDLWLYERPAAATRRRIIVDVKNKKSPKAAERIIWIKGLQAALGAESAIVATTDRRPSSKRLAKNLGIALLDGEAVAKVSSAKRISGSDSLSSLEIDNAVKEVDRSRHSADWKNAVHSARASLLTGLGAHSGNRSLTAFLFFAHEAVNAQPGSKQAELAIRLSYLTAALAMISLDYVIADNAFRSIDERRAAILNSVRYGQAEVQPQLSAVDAALGLARKYATNGTAVARQIELGFRADADGIPANIIADYVVRAAAGDAMFQIARVLESASVSRALQGFDMLTPAAKSALGAFLDFGSVSREAFAKSWYVADAMGVHSGESKHISTDPTPFERLLPSGKPMSRNQSESADGSAGPLFVDKSKT